jgi:flagellar basal-body rod protein FlgG
MNVSLYQAAAALDANSQWQDVIADNLASSGVPGFRKQMLATAAAQAGLTTSSSAVFSLPKTSTSISFEPGEMQYTGDNNDVGIDGRSFFQVKLPNGKIAATRDGEFQVNAKSQLVTKEGYPVMGQEGPIQLDASNPGPMSISEDGSISQGTEIKDKLKLVDFKNPQLLTQISGSYFLAGNPKVQSTAGTGSLRDGYLEGSNTSVTGEMANMMTAMRTFEANQHVIQIQDDRLGKVISDLGNPS